MWTGLGWDQSPDVSQWYAGMVEVRAGVEGEARERSASTMVDERLKSTSAETR